MLVVQNNCAKGYENTITVLQNALDMGAGIACIQEPFIGARDIQHNGFSLHWLGGERKDVRIFTAIRKDLVNRVVVEKRSDLIDHSYIMVLDVRDLDRETQLPIRATRIVNVYNQVIGRGRTYKGGSKRRRRAIEDVNWNQVITERTIFISDFNTHSPMWNPVHQPTTRARTLEELLTQFELMTINELGVTTRRSSENMSIIDLTITSPSMGDSMTWNISDSKYLSMSNHKLIIVKWEDLAEDLTLLNSS